ncbi:sterol desaturase family protein [Pseudomonas fluorescens]|uniref:sterol desaturase family protein n=1 Tax=Pseudomonas fluorescens TaxID=294 RepID=UPI002181E35C|nr:sterol desaturase family protein [Pseudomonas fluorescens]
MLDLSLYAMHRISHRVHWLWHFHMPHHSAERLYWVNGERRHPLHAMLMAGPGPGLVILFAAGAPSAVVAIWFGILTVHLAFQLSNLDYRHGWLRHIIGVAEIHRWHHKRDFEDAQVNYGEFLMVWDRLFGTFYDSVGKRGQAEVGLHEKDYPKNYLGQLIEPFEHDRIEKG